MIALMRNPILSAVIALEVNDKMMSTELIMIISFSAKLLLLLMMMLLLYGGRAGGGDGGDCLGTHCLPAVRASVCC